ncbi:methyltransferase domain-containing protein [Methanospirillum sp.]|uniref:class I SAM-dependent methyltransferase n=1 Tax=Methanospirillum sp. TaxID=45200 RepID=UPI00359FD0B9
MDEDQNFLFFLNFYADLPRQGPGEGRITTSVLGLLTDLPLHPVTIDMGCGSGVQTLELARAGCQVTAVDLYPVILDHLIERICNEDPMLLITPVCASMDTFRPAAPVDLIWSEGAVYIIGFEKGLSLWKEHVKVGGYVVVSELTWFTSHPPSRLKEFWEQEYPSMKTESVNQEIIGKCGYRWMGSVVLPDSAWDAFYAPQKEKITLLRDTGSLSKGEEEVLTTIEEEIRLFEEYRGMYGYVFYLMQRIS